MADPFGGFTEEALAAYQKALAEGEGVEFSEGNTYDFTRCVRPDGSAYGTGGKCRKGTEGAKEEVKKNPKKTAGNKKSDDDILSKVDLPVSGSELGDAMLEHALTGLGSATLMENGIKDSINDSFEEAGIKRPKSMRDDEEFVQKWLENKAMKEMPSDWAKNVSGGDLYSTLSGGSVSSAKDLAKTALKKGVDKKEVKAFLDMAKEDGYDTKSSTVGYKI